MHRNAKNETKYFSPSLACAGLDFACRLSWLKQKWPDSDLPKNNKLQPMVLIKYSQNGADFESTAAVSPIFTLAAEIINSFLAPKNHRHRRVVLSPALAAEMPPITPQTSQLVAHPVVSG